MARKSDRAEYEYIRVARIDGVGRLTLDRPEVLNALIPEMMSEIVAAMRRFGRSGEFRSNLHRGGTPVKVDDLDPECANLALRATEAVGLRFSGVDILEADRGPLVIEVNSSPGFQGLEEASDVNVARRVVEFAVQVARDDRPATRTG